MVEKVFAFFTQTILHTSTQPVQMLFCSFLADRMMCLRGPINGLLLCTKPVRWRVPLQRFLTDYSSLDDPLREGLVFISTMVSERAELSLGL